MTRRWSQPTVRMLSGTSSLMENVQHIDSLLLLSHCMVYSVNDVNFVRLNGSVILSC
jgi:hypothetical protein